MMLNLIFMKQNREHEERVPAFCTGREALLHEAFVFSLCACKRVVYMFCVSEPSVFPTVCHGQKGSNGWGTTVLHRLMWGLPEMTK